MEKKKSQIRISELHLYHTAIQAKLADIKGEIEELEKFLRDAQLVTEAIKAEDLK